MMRKIVCLLVCSVAGTYRMMRYMLSCLSTYIILAHQTRLRVEEPLFFPLQAHLHFSPSPWECQVCGRVFVWKCKTIRTKKLLGWILICPPSHQLLALCFFPPMFSPHNSEYASSYYASSEGSRRHFWTCISPVQGAG